MLFFREFVPPSDLHNIEFLRTIHSPAANTEDSEMSDQQEDDIDTDIRKAVKDSIMEVDKESESDSEDENKSVVKPGDAIPSVVLSKGAELEEPEEDEGIEDGGAESEGEVDRQVNEVPLPSVDDLDANFALEKIVAESSDDEADDIMDVMSDEDPHTDSKNRRGFSADQLQLETRRKDNRGRGIFKDRGMAREKGLKRLGKKVGQNIRPRNQDSRDSNHHRNRKGGKKDKRKNTGRIRGRGRTKGNFKKKSR